MIEEIADVVVVGGGPAGLAAAISAKDSGAERVLVLDRNDWLGGILPQCIHDGFGVEELGRSLTGPEYANLYSEKARDLEVEFMTGTMVLELVEGPEVRAVNCSGLHRISAGGVVLAMGCRERTRWHSRIPGTRPSGIYTAGVAQGFVNLHNRMVGKKVVVLGSGDVGLIMARRLTLEGAVIVAVVEAMPEPSGLPRNVVQCLEDHGIPLHLGHTVTEVMGMERLEGVRIAQVDADMKPVPGTERHLECDTLLLSLGLIPENELARGCGIEMDERTGGPLVNQDLQASIPGVFACGNCLHVHDSVDALSKEAKRAGTNAAGKIDRSGADTGQGKGLVLSPGGGVRYVVPQVVDRTGDVELYFRAERRLAPADLSVKQRGDVLLEKRLKYANPPNMVRARLSITEEMLAKGGELEVTLHD